MIEIFDDVMHEVTTGLFLES